MLKKIKNLFLFSVFLFLLVFAVKTFSLKEERVFAEGGNFNFDLSNIPYEYEEENGHEDEIHFDLAIKPFEETDLGKEFGLDNLLSMGYMMDAWNYPEQDNYYKQLAKTLQGPSEPTNHLAFIFVDKIQVLQGISRHTLKMWH